MLNLLQPGKGKGRLRLRLSALLCLLLLLGASTAEVAHHHSSDFLTKSAGKQQGPQDQQGQQQKKSAETLCPLCIAMHAVLPVAAPVAITLVGVAQDPPHVAPSSCYNSLWSFELFGRPPPSGTFAHV